ncbi:TrbC/VirB2 family protein [Brevibacillus sp. 179-C9.3 HS]|uniref:TrbC/VirB2 family protein n=1 Tax=unclassified Brevibacillus TaxID=2684853 RepID=UPI0039A1E9D3
MKTNIKKFKRIMSFLMVFALVFSVFTPAAYADGVNYDTDSKVENGIWNVVNKVGGIGGAFFTLMFLVITLVIASKAVSPQNQGMLWGGLITCAIAGVIFFSAYFLTNDLKGVLS